jgi:hypothetical protein
MIFRQQDKKMCTRNFFFFCLLSLFWGKEKSILIAQFLFMNDWMGQQQEDVLWFFQTKRGACHISR